MKTAGPRCLAREATGNGGAAWGGDGESDAGLRGSGGGESLSSGRVAGAQHGAAQRGQSQEPRHGCRAERETPSSAGSTFQSGMSTVNCQPGQCARATLQPREEQRS